MKYNRIFITLFVILFLGMIFPYNVRSVDESKPTVNISIPEIKTGDLIARKGKGIISQVFAQLSDTPQGYSHIGIIWIIEEEAFVLHIIDQPSNNKNHLQLDPLNEFIGVNSSLLNGFYSLELKQQHLENLPDHLTEIYSKNILFDDKFDLQNNEAMYCTEFIRYCIMKATGDMEYFPLEHRNKLPYITIGNILSKASEI